MAKSAGYRAINAMIASWPMAAGAPPSSLRASGAMAFEYAATNPIAWLCAASARSAFNRESAASDADAVGAQTRKTAATAIQTSFIASPFRNEQRVAKTWQRFSAPQNYFGGPCPIAATLLLFFVLCFNIIGHRFTEKPG